MNEASVIKSATVDVAIVPNVLDALECPVCHVHGKKRYLCTVSAFQVAVCDYCDVDFVYPMPTDAELLAYYDSSEYFEGGVQGGYENYDKQTENVLEMFGTLLDRFSA